MLFLFWAPECGILLEDSVVREPGLVSKVITSTSYVTYCTFKFCVEGSEGCSILRSVHTHATCSPNKVLQRVWRRYHDWDKHISGHLWWDWQVGQDGVACLRHRFSFLQH